MWGKVGTEKPGSRVYILVQPLNLYEDLSF